MNLFKKLISIVFMYILVCFLSDTKAQTVVNGRITSLNGELIPNILVTATVSNQTDIFTQVETSSPGKDGNYSLIIHDPGIYTIEIIAVHHQRLHIPIMIFDQDEIELDIQLVPRRTNDGTYFHIESYTEWIRAYGNFNDYDFHSGVIFQSNTDGSISATISADKDTIRYQVYGINGGNVPLPDAEIIHLRDDKTFEGIIIPPSDAVSVELRYDPQLETVYTKNIDKISSLPSQQPRAILSFEKNTDYLWVKPISLVNRTDLNYTIDQEILINEQSKLSDPDDLMQHIEHLILSAHNYRQHIKSLLENYTVHKQQNAALYIAYMGLLEQSIRWATFMSENETIKEISIEKPSLNFLHKLISEVHPLHPLWARNNRAATLLLDVSNFDPEIVHYTQQMVQQHPDDLVVSDLVLAIIEEHADQYKDAREMPEYQWVVERYGENNLARKVIVTFLRAKQNE